MHPPVMTPSSLTKMAPIKGGSAASRRKRTRTAAAAAIKSGQEDRWQCHQDQLWAASLVGVIVHGEGRVEAIAGWSCLTLTLMLLRLEALAAVPRAHQVVTL